MRLLAILSVFSIVITQQAFADEYRLVPFDIAGNTNVAINAINDSGIAVGSYYVGGQSVLKGFVGKQGTTSVLPSIVQSKQYRVTPMPTGINDEGTVIGNYWFGSTYLFVWKSGRYTVTGVGQAAGGDSSTTFSPSISGGGQLTFNADVGDGETVPYYGTQKAQTRLTVNGFAEIASSNRSMQQSGEYLTFVGNTPTQAVFLASLSQVIPLLPPGAQSSSGGWINEKGEVGGAYHDTAGLKGFVYSGGNYRTFVMPTSPVTLTTQGIDKHGRVVGAYADKQNQYAFLFSHGNVKQLASFPIADIVHVSISQSGKQIAVSDTDSTSVSRSYTAACSKSDC